MLAAVIELKDASGETYLVTPEIATELPGEVVAKMLVTAITRQGTLFVWPVKIPSDTGRKDNWSASMLEAVELATKSWIRVSANMQLGAYEVYEAIRPSRALVMPREKLFKKGSCKMAKLGWK